MLQERMGLEKFVPAQMYYSLVGRGLEYEFQSFAEYHNIGILVWSPLAGGFLTGKYSRANPAPAGVRLLQNPATWTKMDLSIDREELTKLLDGVRLIRNDVMHFDPDPMTPKELGTLKRAVRFLQKLYELFPPVSTT